MPCGVRVLCLICTLLPQSVRAAGGRDYWDSDTTDSFTWQKRLELVLDNPDALQRSGEPIEIPLDRLPWVADEILASLRVVDPASKPDAPREVGGNDLPFQIDQTEAGAMLVFQVDCPAGQDRKTIHLYASPGQTAPTAQYSCELTATDQQSQVRLSNSRLTVDVGSYLERVWLDGKQVLDAGYWSARQALASGQSAGHRGARVRQRRLTSDGPVRKRLHLETDCDASLDPKAVSFALDIDLYCRRPELRISAVIRPQNVRSPSFQFTAAVSPDGNFQPGRTHYAMVDRSGKPFQGPFSDTRQPALSSDTEDAAVFFDSVTRSGSLVLVAGRGFQKYVLATDEGRIQVHYRPSPPYMDDELRWAEFWLAFLDGGPELLDSYARCRRQPLRPFLGGDSLAVQWQRPGLLRRGADADLTRLVLHVRGSDARPLVEAWEWDTAHWAVLHQQGTTLYEAPRSKALLSPRGEMRLRIKPVPQGVYLLGSYPGVPIPLESQSWLRSNSLSYCEEPFSQGQDIRLGHRSHRVEFASDPVGGDRPKLDGEFFLAEPVRVMVRGQMARRESAGLYRDAWGNPIRVDVREDSDRLRFEVSYMIQEPQETWSNVSLVFRPSSPLREIESLTLDPLADGYSQLPIACEGLFEFCRFPLLSLRCRNRQYLCFVDHDLSNLMLRTTPTEAAVEYWAWPNQRHREYRWSFELVPGYGTFANAVLRALDPYTAEFCGKLPGACSYPEATRRPAEAFAAGVRSVIYNGATYRQGVYFRPEQPLDALYDTPLQKITSYRQIIEDVRRSQEQGLKVLFLMHFGGISSPVIPDFFDSLVQDHKRDLVKIGRDGLFATYWGNPNPDWSYGRGLLDQLEGILETLHCDGIAMDRCDRLDNFDGDNLFDLAHCDGSATPYKHGGEYRPCSSIALQAKRFWFQFRQRLDRHQALWIANQPRSMLVFRLADAVKADLHHSPWNLFYLRSMSNGKTFFVHSRPLCRDWSAASDRLAQLVQAQSIVEVTPHQPIYQAGQPRDHSRLLYIVPSEDPYPRYWLFHKGGAVLDYDPTGENTAQCYQASRLIEAKID